jgi:hypothetical protein
MTVLVLPFGFLSLKDVICDETGLPASIITGPIVLNSTVIASQRNLSCF